MRNTSNLKIKAFIAKGESETLELKKSTAQLFSAFETLYAFLNGKGGMVIIGVTDNGKIMGQEISDSTKQAIAHEISKIEPHPQINIEYLNVEKNKKVILLSVKQNTHAPYTYDGRAFYREQSVTRKMSQHRYEQLLIERGYLNHSWEKAISVGKTINDLDVNEIRRAVKQGIAAGRVPTIAENEDIENILKSWGLIEEGKINNAAMVLFAREALPRYPQCHIKVGRFRGTDMLGDFIDNREFFGNAFRIFEEANSFIMRHLPIASFFEVNSFQRIDKPALPALAVREALVNAICHRDYSNSSSAITMAIFDDRMEIWNNGKLPASLKLNDLNKKHQSESPNKIIAKVFYDRKYFDGWGTGINKIFQLCHKNNVPEPRYEEYSGGVEIKFQFREPIGFSTEAETDFSQYQLNTRQKNILKILLKGLKMTVSEIAQLLDNPPSARTIGDELAYLRQLNLVSLEGFGRGSRWFLENKGAVKGR